MRESVPTARYSPVCNVLRQWKTSLILTYRVYRLYDTETTGYFPTTTTAKPTLHMAVTYSTTGIIKCLLILLFYIYIPSGQLLDQYHRVGRLYIIESVDSISKDERGFPLTQYITNGRISHGAYTFTHFKHYHRVLRLISYSMSI